MEISSYLSLLHIAEAMKNHTRQSLTSSGRHESVAEHTFRLCLMAWFCQDEFPELDMEKVWLMCLFHDFGEAFTGDIPAFEKQHSDEKREETCLHHWLTTLPAPYRDKLRQLYQEMQQKTTPEAKLYKALDKLEALIQHNEAGCATWLDLEYDLQLTYGQAECQAFPYTQALRRRVEEDSLALMREEQERGTPWPKKLPPRT